MVRSPVALSPRALCWASKCRVKVIKSVAGGSSSAEGFGFDILGWKCLVVNKRWKMQYWVGCGVSYLLRRADKMVGWYQTGMGIGVNLAWSDLTSHSVVGLYSLRFQLTYVAGYGYGVYLLDIKYMCVVEAVRVGTVITCSTLLKYQLAPCGYSRKRIYNPLLSLNSTG